MSSKAHCFIFLLLYFLKQYDSDMILKKIKDIKMYKDSPKVWHRYITSFLHIYLIRSIHTKINCKKLLGQMFYYSKSFKFLSKKSIKFDYSYSMPRITSSSGHHCTNTDNGNEWSYYFIPNSLLKINFTFNLISVQGHLNISDHWSKIFVKREFVYRGYYSIFCLYPGFKAIYFINNPLGKYVVNVSFAVIDENIIYNGPLKNYSHIKSLKVNFKYIITRKYVYISYFLQVRKLYQVFVKIFHLKLNEFFIADGPGILSDTLRNLPIQKCSTFQCIIYLLSTPTGYFKFYSRPLTCTERLQIHQYKYVSIHLPNEKCLNNVCIFCANAVHGHQVNATVTKIISLNLFDSFCVLAGLVADENLEDDTEAETLCESHDETNDPSRGFYSHNSS